MDVGGWDVEGGAEDICVFREDGEGFCGGDGAGVAGFAKLRA